MQYVVGMQYTVGVAKSTLCELTFLHQHLLRTTSSLNGFDLFALTPTAYCKPTAYLLRPLRGGTMTFLH